MISSLNSKRTIFVYILLCFFLSNCVSPEDNAIKVPAADSANIVPEKSEPEVHTVEINGMKFQPEEINVKGGDTIIWINHDMVTHCVTEEKTKTWTSGNIVSGASWQMAVKSSADYFCAIHQVMKGKIIVE